MKRSLVILCIGLAVTVSLAFKMDSIKGWFLAGSYPAGYDISIEKSPERNGNVAYLRSVKTIPKNKFGTMMQTFMADDYLGKRVRLTGYIKSNQVTDWAGMWFRIDGENSKNDYLMLGFDNMEKRPIKGTTGWKKYDIVLDVPKNAKSVAYGVLLSGPGEVWIDDLSFEVVTKDVPSTNMIAPVTAPPTQPQNTNFEDQKN